MAPSNKEGWINWRASAARNIMLDDLRLGYLPVDAKDLSAEDAWQHIYQHIAEFSGVVFAQFKARLQDYRREAKKDVARAAVEYGALMHDRALFPRNETVFDLSKAKLLLRADVAEKKHETMTPSQLQGTRAEYKAFKARSFKQRIYQEVWRAKFINLLVYNRNKGLTPGTDEDSEDGS
jgi:hypothetical protein